MVVKNTPQDATTTVKVENALSVVAVVTIEVTSLGTLHEHEVVTAVAVVLTEVTTTIATEVVVIKEATSRQPSCLKLTQTKNRNRLQRAKQQQILCTLSALTTIAATASVPGEVQPVVSTAVVV